MHNRWSNGHGARVIHIQIPCTLIHMHFFTGKADYNVSCPEFQKENNH